MDFPSVCHKFLDLCQSDRLERVPWGSFSLYFSYYERIFSEAEYLFMCLGIFFCELYVHIFCPFFYFFFFWSSLSQFLRVLYVLGRFTIFNTQLCTPSGGYILRKKNTNFELSRINSGSGIGIVTLILILCVLYNKQMSKYIDVIENLVHSVKKEIKLWD